METQEKLNATKEEVETMNEKFAEMSDKEPAEIIGGIDIGIVVSPDWTTCHHPRYGGYRAREENKPQSCSNCWYYYPQEQRCTAMYG